MRNKDDRLIFSASDINNYLECEHLTSLEIRRARGEIERPKLEDPHRELLFSKGHKHEARYLQSLRDRGLSITEIERVDGDVEATIKALHEGPDVIYQAAFEHEGWVGYADFLIKRPGVSELGDYHYEVGDTKLAMTPKPYHLVQLCFYHEQLSRLQGVEATEVFLILGDGREERFRVHDYDAYFRKVRGEFLGSIKTPRETYPLPCSHCDICDWRGQCELRRLKDDHLSLVAGMRRSHIVKLNEIGVNTVAELGATTIGPERINARTFDGLRLQAELQDEARRTGEQRYELLPRESADRGFALLPEPSKGDVFFDMEGDPIHDDGALEYLFGVVTVDEGDPVFQGWWAHDHVEEKAAFEGFIDFLMARLERFPDLHVYHYAFYEPAAMKRLMGRHATRENEVDQLLRSKVFVDLYKVVKQSMRVSQPRYSIKNMEVFYREKRSGEINEGATSIVEYERWIATRDADILENIRAYNEIDCVSTFQLRDWLLGRAAEARALFPDPPPAAEPQEKEPKPETVALRARVAEMAEALRSDVPIVWGARSDEEHGRWLLSHLLEWHKREERPAWWSVFERQGSTSAELIMDADCIGGLIPEGEPVPAARSLIHTFRFPPQDHKLSGDSDVFDAPRAMDAGRLLEVNDAEGWLTLKRGPKFADLPLPEAIGPGGPYRTEDHQKALARLGESVLANGLDGLGPYRAVREMLLCRPPRVIGVEPGSELAAPDEDATTAATRIVLGLDSSALFIQGPPGSGKTYTAARAIVALMQQGRRVGVCANSHKAIHNLLDEVEEAASAAGFDYAGVKKSSRDDEDKRYDSEHIRSNADLTSIATELNETLLVAGTSWLFTNDKFDRVFDTIVIDEAGQISLANACAIGTAATNLVLVGDPMQLAQVSQGAHPPGADASVLEHLLGEGHTTIPADRGLFISNSRRMHPDVCEFISKAMYEDRLHALEGNELRVIAGDAPLSGSGLRFAAIHHAGNVQKSPEEADYIADALSSLIAQGVFRSADGSSPLTLEEILVVAPYNVQVNHLRESLPEGARVGTVDKFQGQEAPIVFYSMATSSPDELPRTLEFLFSRNRLNVAISRAQSLAVLVACPELFHVRCTRVEQMPLVNALCRFVEMATPAG